MNGADLLCRILLDNEIDTCFANPGTSEMHLVAALDRYPQMRCVLGLFEGVVTGAADGYGRMSGKPAATLLHLGPGLANGLANLHNARRARTPVVNIVGDHASHHLQYDAPLTSDIESLARPMSVWVGRANGRDDVARAVTEAIAMSLGAGPEGPGVATLIMPGDAAWTDFDSDPGLPPRVVAPAAPAADRDAVAAAAERLQGDGRTAIILGGQALTGRALDLAGAIAAHSGAMLTCETQVARADRGSSRVPLIRIPYNIEQAVELLRDVDTAILVSGRDPVGFFGYPNKPARMLPEGAEVLTLTDPTVDPLPALEALAEWLGADPVRDRPAKPAPLPAPPAGGRLNADQLVAVLTELMPGESVLCDESVSSARDFFTRSEQAAPHDYIQLTGGAIGEGIPMAAGAAIGAPGRKVISLQADGSGLYTVQGLWTQARERLDVVTVVLANRAYRILEGELRAVGATQAGPSARRMLELTDPAVNWVQVAAGFGVEGAVAEDAETFRDLFAAALTRPGPFLIEAVID